MEKRKLSPLRNIKVVDLSKVLAGPLCGQILGNLGADVIKVEPLNGDDTRSWLPQKNGESATFLSVNSNKRSLAVDLKSEAGQEIVHELIRSADIVIQGFGAKTARKLKVDYDTALALNNQIIYCEISGYGRQGPLGEEPGYDVMLQAFSGMISTMGVADGDFCRASFSPVDLGTGANAAIGILAAVLERALEKKSIYVDVSLLDTSIGLMTYLAQNYWLSGKLPQKMGTGHPAMCPYQAFPTADGHLMLGVGNDAQWEKFCHASGLERYVADPRFKTNADRVEHFQETVALVQECLATKTTEQWMEILRAAGVACSYINTLDKALAHPQLQTRELISENPHPTLGVLHSISLPIRFNDESRAHSLPPPLLGQHTEEILRSIGLTEEKITLLLEDSIIKL